MKWKIDALSIEELKRFLERLQIKMAGKELCSFFYKSKWLNNHLLRKLNYSAI